MYNERVFNILLESSRAKKECVSKAECCDECDSFQDTIGNGANFEKTIKKSDFTMSAETIPICKKECGKDECGEECCKEEYYIDGRLLDIYMSDNGIENDAQAVFNICEHYGISPKDVYVVIESDEVNKGLIDHAKTYIDCGLLRRCHDQIRNCINHGIKVAKKS